MTSIVNNIYEVFKGFFGEDKVDYQDNWIYVYWPEVRVTNENNRSIDIYGLYSKIQVLNSGQLCSHKPYFIRDTYNYKQWNGGYMHSHLPRVYSNNGFFTWSDRPCLGTGPINHTISKLRGAVSSNPRAFEDMDIWRIFCWELDKYVHIESLAGGPYYRLESISNLNQSLLSLPEYRSTIYYNLSIYRDADFINEFCRYLIRKKVIKIAYLNGCYYIGDSYCNTALNISDAFIEWYNNEEKYEIVSKEDLIKNNYIQEVVVRGTNLYTTSRSGSSTLDSNIGRSLGFTFKGTPVTMHRQEGDTDESPNTSIILHNYIMGYILYKILIYLNTEYGKSNNNDSAKTSSSEEIITAKKIIKVI